MEDARMLMNIVAVLTSVIVAVVVVGMLWYERHGSDDEK